MAEAAMTPWVTGFGDDPHSWNLHRDEAEQDGEGSGLPGVELIASVIGTWRWLTDDVLTTERVATVLNLPVDLAGLALVAAPLIMRHSDEDPTDVALSDLASLLGAWSHLRGVDSSVALAAATFGVHPTHVIEAVGAGFFMYLTGDRDDLTKLMIELDGE